MMTTLVRALARALEELASAERLAGANLPLQNKGQFCHAVLAPAVQEAVDTLGLTPEVENLLAYWRRYSGVYADYVRIPSKCEPSATSAWTRHASPQSEREPNCDCGPKGPSSPEDWSAECPVHGLSR